VCRLFVLEEMFDQFGITERVKDKIEPNPPDRVPQVVAAGEVRVCNLLV
jgi:hypothetical protein